MKKSKIVISSILSCLCVLGTIFGIKVNNSSFNKTQKVAATAIPTGIYVEIAESSSWHEYGATLANVSVYFYGGDYGDPSWDVKYPVDVDTGYVAVPEHDGIRPVNCIICVWGGGNNNQSNDLTLDTDGYCKFVASGEVSYGKQGGYWTTYSGITSEYVYIDASNWVSEMGDNIPYCHYWDNQYIYDDVEGENIDRTDIGTECVNKKWWRFELKYRDSGSLHFIFMYNSFAKESASISYDRYKNAFYLNGTNKGNPIYSFLSMGQLYQIAEYKKVGTSSSTQIGIDYLLHGESYEVPGLPGAETGYDTPTTWNTSESGEGTSYAPSSWIDGLSRSISLYAIYTDAVYTITYYRNNGTSLQATQSKDHGYNVYAYTPGTNPLTDTGWNPSSYRNFKHWNTAFDDSGASYNPGAIISTEASFPLYYIEDWYDFRYRVDSGSWINLVHNDEGKGEGIQGQFSPTSAQYLPAGGKLSFQYSSNGGVTWTNLTGVGFEGNYDSTYGIDLSTSDTIFLKFNISEEFICYVPGLSERTIAICDTAEATSGIAYTMKGDSDTQCETVLAVPIEAGQYIKRGYAGDYTLGTYYAGGTGKASLCFEQVPNNLAVLCKVTGVYIVFNQKGGGGWPDLYFTRNEEASAKYLAQKFNSIVGEVCTAIVGGSKGLSDLQGVWGSNTSSTLYKHFNNQIDDTMEYFSTSSSTSDVDILECINKYDYIEKKYGTNALPDFLSRDNNYNAYPQSSIKLVLFNASINNTSIILIVIISSISVSMIGGYFFIRRKKQK